VQGRSRRVLLQGTQPPGGGFRAAKYFTYVFFALGIVVVGFFVSVCVLHCRRRRVRQRAHQQQQQALRQQPYSLPSPLVRADSSKLSAYVPAPVTPSGLQARDARHAAASEAPCMGSMSDGNNMELRQGPTNVPQFNKGTCCTQVEIHLHEAVERSRSTVAPVPLKEFDGVLILHPDGRVPSPMLLCLAWMPT